MIFYNKLSFALLFHKTVSVLEMLPKEILPKHSFLDMETHDVLHSAAKF